MATAKDKAQVDLTAPPAQDQQVTLAHHWHDPISGTSYGPGEQAKVTPDQVRTLVGAGYVAGVDPDVPEQRAAALGEEPPATTDTSKAGNEGGS